MPIFEKENCPNFFKMSRKSVGVSLGSAIFIFLLIAVLALIRPTYLRIRDALSEFENQLSQKLQDETGLAFSYQSLSPSIFIGINFKNISIHEVSSGNKLVGIKRATLSYNVADFFSKNPKLAVRAVTLNGVSLEYNAAKNSEFIEKIKTLIEKRKKNNDVKSDELMSIEKDSKVVVSEREFDIPFDILIKKFSVHYSDSQNDVIATLKTLNLKDFSLSDGIGINTAGTLAYKTGLLKTGGKWASLACGFSVSGTFFPNFEGSSALLSLSGQNGADYTLSRLDLLLNYADQKLELRSMRTVLPFSLFASYDFEQSVLDLSGNFEKFNPLKLVSIRRKNPTIKKIDGTLLSGSLLGKISKESLNYSTDLKIEIPKKLLGESMNVELKCNGDKNNLEIKNLAASGSFVDADFAGSFDFKKMQPAGLLNLNYFILKNDGVISTEVYIDPYRNGFTCVAPQFFLGDKSFTGVQFSVFPGDKSVDFEFELLDFAHPDYDEIGRLQLNGSLLSEKQKFLQANLTVSNIFADSIVDTVSFFLPKENAEKLTSVSEKLKPYIIATEAYISTDFKEFTVNAPENLFANTEKDLELLRFSVDGSKQTFQISQFDLLFGRQSAHADISLDFADSLKEFSFVSDLTVNSVPYRFFGSFSPEGISVSGDYDFDAVISIDYDQIGATLQFYQFPFSVGKYVFAASSSAIVHWGVDSGFDADIVSFELTEPSAYLSFSPRIAFSGSLSKYGFTLTTLAYSDSFSSLDGSGTFLWNLNDGIFDSIHASLSAQSPISNERFSLSADLANPSMLPFSADAIKNDFYISLDASVSSFPSARLLPLQNPENTISADFTVSGTASNPFVSVMLHRSSLLLAGYPLGASGSFIYDDTGAHIADLNFDWSVLKVSDINAFFNPASFNGNASLTIDAELMGKTLHAPFEITLDGSVPENKFKVADYYSVTLQSPKVSGDFIASDFPFKLIAVHTPGRYDIMTDVKNGFSASYTTDGMIKAVAGKKSPVQFNLNGGIKQNNLNLDLTGIVADMRFICSEVEIPFVSFNSGLLTGAIRVSGPTTDPEFTGAFSVAHPNFEIPFISKNYLHAEKVIMTVDQGEAVVPPTLVTLGKGLATVEYRMEFNRWIPNSLELKINIEDKRKVPLDLSFPFIHAKGLASGSLDLAYTIPNDVNISGFVIADNTDVEIVATPLQNQFSLDNILASVPTKNKSDINVTVDFDIIVGQKVQLLFNPFLRGVVAPGTPLSIYFDSYTGDLEFKSDITLRGGEIAWLNRNFYMREGRIVFNETQDSIDPKVTLRAETRERDENGNMVTIILSAINQPVSTFNPTFSANPAKSEREIMQLLGQVLSGDSAGVSDILGSGGDFFIQSTVMRRVENTLRELLNFDIFSIRTNVVQNSLRLSMDENTNNKQISVGNFIDNSTVYMGKYFGSSIYVDSMFHWSYDENKIDNGTSVNGIVFQPEIGFEMTSPFVNIRLGVAPDIDSLQKGLLNTWVPSTSMTLSWKFAF